MNGFKEIPGFSGYYINESGDIYSNWKRGLLSTKTEVSGYKRVGIMKDAKQRHFFVHRLVAITFLDNPENKRTVNHKDGNKTNNSLDNLEWATDRENSLHATTNGLAALGENHHKSKLTENDVLVVRHIHNNYEVSYSKISRHYGVSVSTIERAVTGKSWKHI